jgi:hypothetical protein
MKKVTNLNNENYFNMCGCQSSFEGNENLDNGYNMPRYSNAIGDASTLDIDNENESGFQSNFDNFLNASKKKKKREAITTQQVADAINKTKGVVDKASEVADVLAKGGVEPIDMPMGSDNVLTAPAKSNTLKYVAIYGGIALLVFVGYKFFYKK